MISYKVINWDFNRDCIEYYDIIPYLYTCLKKNLKKEKLRKKDITYEWLRDMIDRESKYMFWARCEYEVIIHGWPVKKHDYKLDVYEQIKMNLDNITRLMYEDLKG